MAHDRCVTLPDGTKICFPVYYLIPEWWWRKEPPPPDPWPWYQVVDPRVLPEEFQKDLTIISAMKVLAQELSSVRGKVVQAALNESLRDLPKGVKMG